MSEWCGLPPRFAEKIIPVTESGCWIWMGATNSKGYGRVNYNGKNRFAHRVIYENLVGSIPSDLQLDHLCTIKCCVNPLHLEPVTNAENVLRGWRARGKHSHCINGHPIDGMNNWRQGIECRACRLIRAATPEAKSAKRQRYLALKLKRKADVF